MLSSERTEFDKILEELHGALDKPLTEAKREGFWKSLQSMTLVQFARSRDLLLASLADGQQRKAFTAADIWNALRGVAGVDGVAVTPGSRGNEIGWEQSLRTNPTISKLLLAAALKARYEVAAEDGAQVDDKLQWLRDHVAALLRQADAGKVLADYRTRRLVLELFGAAGIRRLEDRSKVAA